MTDIIQLLPDHIANQIAAGEVVQRPASVVKELLENSVDAGSTHIKLIIKDAGKTLIQVVDNGKGMSATDARMSFERHATSKIKSSKDLFQLNTKGFRGEALASIAAIAHIKMNTRLLSDDIGTQIQLEGGKIVTQEATATPKGTAILVKNLFFNIPARRNFLKSDAVEMRHIIDEFHRVALAHPDIHFDFYNNGSELFNLSVSNLRQRIVNVFGGKTNEKLVPVKECTEIVKIEGFICKPEYAKKTRGEQFFFVNNRFIKSSYLHHAVNTAFTGLLKDGCHPGYFIFLEVAPTTIDINIHPTKTEIKFEDERTIYAILRASLKHSLGQFNVAPLLDFNRDANLDVPYNKQSKTPKFPTIEVDANYNPFNKENKGKVNLREKPSFGIQSQWESLYVGNDDTLKKDFSEIELESEEVTGSIFESEEESSVVTFQLHKKYIVTTIKSGMVIIHQNRAHQRILYEEYLKKITLDKGISQQLLFPLSLSFSKPEISLLEQATESLEHIGFIFSKIEGEGVIIKAVPFNVQESEVQNIFQQVLADIQQETNTNDTAFSQTDMLAKSLCKSLAIKSGTVINTAMQNGIVNDLFATKEPALSPFSKPVYITMTVQEFDNKFL